MVRPFWARARALRIYVSFLGPCSDLTRFGDFRRVDHAEQVTALVRGAGRMLHPVRHLVGGRVKCPGEIGLHRGDQHVAGLHAQLGQALDRE